jgi:hypothetical protein
MCERGVNLLSIFVAIYLLPVSIEELYGKNNKRMLLS